jgi:hypothetical protein
MMQLDEVRRSQFVAMGRPGGWNALAAALWQDTLTADSGPGALLSWLEGANPQTQSQAWRLLLALSQQPWRVRLAAIGATPEIPGAVVLLVQTGTRRWQVHLRRVPNVTAFFVEKL